MVVDAAATPTLASNIGPAKTGPTGPLAPALTTVAQPRRGWAIYSYNAYYGSGSWPMVGSGLAVGYG